MQSNGWERVTTTTASQPQTETQEKVADDDTQETTAEDETQETTAEDETKHAFKMGRAADDNGEYDTAMNYYLIAAKRGNSAAQNNIGLMYEKGLGVPKSKVKALKWYRKAAAQGNEVSKKHIKNLSRKTDTEKSPSQSA